MRSVRQIGDDGHDELGPAIRKVCARFVALCRQLDLFAEASVAIDGSKFKAVNTRDKKFTRVKMQRRLEQVEESVERYLHQLDSADRQEPSVARATWMKAYAAEHNPSLFLVVNIRFHDCERCGGKGYAV